MRLSVHYTGEEIETRVTRVTQCGFYLRDPASKARAISKSSYSCPLHQPKNESSLGVGFQVWEALESEAFGGRKPVASCSYQL